MGNVGKAVAASVAGLVILGVIVFGGWKLGWWFRNENANQESHVIRNGYSNQQTLRDEISKNIGQVLAVTTQISMLRPDEQDSAAALQAQRKQIVIITCQKAAQVTGDPLPADQAQFVTANCTAGAIKPGSEYN